MSFKREIMKKTDGDLLRWDPFREMRGMRPFTSLIDEFFSGLRAPLAPYPREGGVERLPQVDIQETEKEYVISAELPGMKKEDISIDVQDRTLSISGERKSEKEEKDRHYLRREQYYGSFRRSFTLPEDVKASEVKAAYHEGLLKVTLPKSGEAKAKTLKVDVE